MRSLHYSSIIISLGAKCKEPGLVTRGRVYKRRRRRGNGSFCRPPNDIPSRALFSFYTHTHIYIFIRRCFFYALGAEENPAERLWAKVGSDAFLIAARARPASRSIKGPHFDGVRYWTFRTPPSVTIS